MKGAYHERGKHKISLSFFNHGIFNHVKNVVLIQDPKPSIKKTSKGIGSVPLSPKLETLASRSSP